MTQHDTKYPDTAHGPRERESVPALTIVAHPHLRRIGERCYLNGINEKGGVAISRKEPDFEAVNDKTSRLALEDIYLSRKPLRLIGDSRGNVLVDCTETRTRVLVDGHPIQERHLVSVMQVRQGVTIELADRICLLLHEAVPHELEVEDQLGLIGESQAMIQGRQDILRIADLDEPVLIRGESGSGKELVARAIHAKSARRDKPLVTVNLGAIPPSLAASELFGAVRGAYTGAVNSQEGYFRSAHSGTLFLDEIGEAPPEVQVMLLRVLESREVYAVGSQKPVRVDVRLIAATDANLESLSQNGDFRAPLLYRLSAYEIWVPALRKRKDDIMRLFMHFAGEARDELGVPLEPDNIPSDPPWIPSPLAAKLVRYHWPGNIRQLRNVTRQLVIDSRDKPHLSVSPRFSHLLEYEQAEQQARHASTPVEALQDNLPRENMSRRRPSDITEEELIKAMESNRWEAAHAARSLGIPRSSIYDLIKKSGCLRMVEDIEPQEIDTLLQDYQGDIDATAEHLRVSSHALRRRMRKMGLDT